MEISILFNYVGLSFLFGLFVFIAGLLTAVHARKVKSIAMKNELLAQKERQREIEQKRLINEAILATFSGDNSDDYFKYYQAREVVKKAVAKAGEIDQ